MKPRISIAMTTYNGEKYLQEQLDSFVAQRRRPDELVICDDNSTDRTNEILNRFREAAPFKVQVVKNPVNLGYVRNFEKTLGLCTGDLIFLSDQDDVWLPEKIDVMVTYLEEHLDCYLLACDMHITDGKLKPSGVTQLEKIALLSGQQSLIFGCGTCIRRQFLELALPIPANVAGHDGWVHSLAISAGVRQLIEQPLQFYRRHGANASNWALSSPDGNSLLNAVNAHGLADATKGWREAIARKEQSLQRLNERASMIEAMGLATQVAAARQDAVTEIDLRQRRINLMSRRRILRAPSVFQLWLNGGYRYFAGWKSAVKDLIRP